MVEEVSKCLSEIENMIAVYRIKYINYPKYLILPIEYRQAIKINYACSIGQNTYDISEIISYYGIPIIKKEEVVIL